MFRMAHEFLQALETWSSNPYELREAAARERSREQVVSGPVAGELARRLQRGDKSGASAVVLAFGHAQACAPLASAREVLGAQELPSSLLKELPHARADYQRIAKAAGRAHRALAELLGVSPSMAALRRDIWAACFGESLLHGLDLERVIRDHDVLVLGETGTGKERVAQVFLEATMGPADGSRAPRAALNAAALPDTLVESELFGHEKGAFTGAKDARLGRLRAAAGGAFFLDEVGDLPQTTQVKLLRVMETNEIQPLGSDSGHEADVRYIAATHKNLESMVEAGEFRRDLFERLAGITVRIPPLRERPEDIEAIGLAFVEDYLPGKASHPSCKAISKWLCSSEARNYAWPGNVRELQNALRNLLLGLPPGLKEQRHASSRSEDSTLPEPIRAGSASLRWVTDWYIELVLRSHQHNLTTASQLLGVDRSTLRRRLKGTA